MLIQLPEVIIREICELLPLQDQYQFLVVSKSFLFLLCNVYRKFLIKLSAEDEEIQRILASVPNPSKQLEIKAFEEDKVLKFCPVIKQCYSLCTNIELYNKYFHHELRYTEQLTLMATRDVYFPSLKVEQESQVHLQKAFEILLDKYWTKNRQSVLSSLTIHGLIASRLKLILPTRDFSFPPFFKACNFNYLDFTSLPLYLFQGLQSLTITNNATLEDVGIFDHIPFLRLQSCPSIRDISGLNHNRSIKLYDCNEIIDFRNSFAFSERIAISVYSWSFLERKERFIDFTHWSNAQSIELFGFSHYLLYPLPKSLKKLSVTLFNSFTLELREKWTSQLVFLEIGSCPTITSVQGLGKIQVLKLVDLTNLENLDGLGSGNKVVTIAQCDKLHDYSAIRYNQDVRIHKSGQWTSLEQIHTIRWLSLEKMHGISIESFSQVEQLTLIDCEIVEPESDQTSQKRGPAILTIQILDLDHSDLEQLLLVYKKVFTYILPKPECGSFRKVKIIAKDFSEPLARYKEHSSKDLVETISLFYEERVLVGSIVYLRRDH